MIEFWKVPVSLVDLTFWGGNRCVVLGKSPLWLSLSWASQARMTAEDPLLSYRCERAAQQREGSRAGGTSRMAVLEVWTRNSKNRISDVNQDMPFLVISLCIATENIAHNVYAYPHRYLLGWNLVFGEIRVVCIWGLEWIWSLCSSWKNFSTLGLKTWAFSNVNMPR